MRMKTNLKRIIINLAILSVFTAVVVYWFDVDLLIQNLNVQFLQGTLVLAASLYGAFFIDAFRLVLFLRPNDVEVSRSFKSIMLAAGFNLFFPAHSSEAIKVAYLKSNNDVKCSTSVASIMLMRFSDVILMGATVLILLTTLPLKKSIITSIVVFVALIFCFVLLWGDNVESLLRKIHIYSIGDSLANTLNSLRHNLKNGAIVRDIAIAAASWFLIYYGYYVFLSSMNVGLGHDAALAVFFCCTFAYAIPALPGGIGTFEAAGVLALAQSGMSQENALVVIILLHFAQTCILLLATLVILVQDNVSPRSLINSFRKTQPAGR